MLISREQEIDEMIEKTKVQGYSTFIQLFTSGFNYLSNLFMTSAVRGQSLLGTQLMNSLQLNDGKNQQSLKASKSNDGYFTQVLDDEEESSGILMNSNTISGN